MITSHTDWTFENLAEAWKEIEIISRDELELVPGKDLYVNQFEVVTSEQMLDAYSSIGLPVYYNHWSFGKSFLENKQAYDYGQMGLALEMVINSNPCINLLMEDNLAYAQIMVMAHAGVGHNAVFANNEYFKEWTDAHFIVDYMKYAREFIRQCEERYGFEEVQMVLDACHSLAPHGVDKFKRKQNSIKTEEQRLRDLISKDDERQKELDIILTKTSLAQPDTETSKIDPDEEEENLLYFIMTNSPKLEQWKREIIRINYYIGNYFSPQAKTKVLNEGFATFCHYYIMQRLEEKGFISPDAYTAFLDCHSSVVFQPNYNSPYYSGANPYALGYAIFRDIKRICENPTDEDKKFMPHLIGRRWQDAVKEAAFEYRDDSFIQQFLSPKVARDLRLFNINIKHKKSRSYGKVLEISDEEGFENIKNAMARVRQPIYYTPHVHVKGADLEGDRILKLVYVPFEGRGLDEEQAKKVISYCDYLWGYEVKLTGFQDSVS